LAMACAAIGDGVGWTLLAFITFLAGSGGVGGVSLMVELTVAFIAVAMLAVRPFVHRVAKRAEHTSASHMLLPTLFGGALAFGSITQLIGLHAASGGFLFGALAPRRSAVVDRLNHQMETFTLKVLLPVFFVGVGLSVDLTQLATDPSRWLLFVGLLVAAFVAKLVGAGFGARLAGCTRGQSFTLGALMNCRGVTELIVVNIGWQAHLISQFALTSFVLVALVTSLVTPWLARAPSVGMGCAGEISDDRIWQLLTEHAEKVPDHDR
jgi:Kef-type K+ transport system membrane component KefB